MSDANVILDKLKGFLEINGDELPTREQWDNIVDLIQDVDDEEESEPPDFDRIREDILKQIKEEMEKDKPYNPFPSTPTYPGVPGWTPLGGGTVLCNYTVGENLFPETLDADTLTDDIKDALIGSGVWTYENGNTLKYIGKVKLSNSLDLNDLMELDSDPSPSVDSKLLETDSVTVEFEPENEAQDDRDNKSG